MNDDSDRKTGKNSGTEHVSSSNAGFQKVVAHIPNEFVKGILLLAEDLRVENESVGEVLGHAFAPGLVSLWASRLQACVRHTLSAGRTPDQAHADAVADHLEDLESTVADWRVLADQIIGIRSQDMQESLAGCLRKEKQQHE